ncbi:MAG TPA: DUF6263 family protein [Flavisolibacter sp.]|nr:DUF6263 family protein [Flavisolibacter sp.]
MKKITLLFFAASATLASLAQNTANKLVLQKGQTIEVTTNMNMTMQTMMGEIPGTVTSVDHYVVGEVNASGIQLTRMPKKMLATFSAMGQENKIDSDDPKSLDNPMAQPIKEMMKQKQDFTIDAYGNVIALRGSEKKKGDAEGGMMSMMMPGMGDGLPVVGQASVFKVLPNKEVKAGDVWADSSSAAGSTKVTVYTVKDIRDNDIFLTYTGDGSSKGTQSAMGQSVDVAATSKGEGTIIVDKTTGLLKQRTATTSTESTMSIAGNEMKSSGKITTVTTVKTL